MNNIIEFHYYKSFGHGNSSSSLGKLVNKVKGFHAQYASTLMFRLSELGYKESHRETYPKTETRWGKNYEIECVKCVWYKDTIDEVK